MAIGIIATLKVQDGKEKDFEATFRDLAKAVRAGERGNKLYQLCKSRKEPNTYVVMEIYESEDALKAHTSSGHYKSLSPALGPTLAGRPDIHYLDTV
ncbi:MAG TPA: antibiotic biosynthesis monooxygenase family protein [Rhizomicrobium sp.]|nr:antibiotic biosynthesis monooxygenase family protein [Rhizomicrobium sp.]